MHKIKGYHVAFMLAKELDIYPQILSDLNEK